MDSLFEDGIASGTMGFEVPDLERVTGELVGKQPKVQGAWQDRCPAE